MLRHAQHELTISTRGRGLYEFTDDVADWLSAQKAQTGLLTLHVRHTSASLTVNENASPDVRRDFESWFDQAVPEGARYWTHTLEGDDDMPAHLKASLLGPSVTIPIADGRLALGTWQGIYLCEHRDHGGPRSLVVTGWGEG